MKTLRVNPIAFKHAYDTAIKEGRESFFYPSSAENGGSEFLVTYAKYVLEYLRLQGAKV